MSRGGGVLRDPVCGRRITRNGAHIVLTYEGEEYRVCCPQCQAQFERNPTRYAHRSTKRRVSPRPAAEGASR